MATLSDFQMSIEQKKRRTFSTEFKIKKVKDIQQKRSTVSQVSKTYGVTRVSVYKWISKYGVKQEAPERVIVETHSDTAKLLEYQRKIAELERLVGQKQVVIDYQSKLIEMAEAAYGIDIKKKLDPKC